jgi:hypothetical protein
VAVTLLELLAGALTVFPVTDTTEPVPEVAQSGWLTFTLIRPTIPAWTAAASC